MLKKYAFWDFEIILWGSGGILEMSGAIKNFLPQ